MANPRKSKAPVAVVDAPSYSLILGLRRHRQGPFAALWELTELDQNGSVKRVIMDASTRGSIMGLIAREVQKAK